MQASNRGLLPLSLAVALAATAQSNDRLKSVVAHEFGVGGITADAAPLSDDKIALLGTSTTAGHRTAAISIRSGGGEDFQEIISLPVPRGAAETAAVAFLGGPNEVVGTAISRDGTAHTIVWSREGDLPTWIWYPIAAGLRNTYVHGTEMVMPGGRAVVAGTQVDDFGRRRGFAAWRGRDGAWHSMLIRGGMESQVLGTASQLVFDDTDGSERVWLQGSMKTQVRRGRNLVTVWLPTVWDLQFKPGTIPAAIAIPNLLDARKGANESSAIGTLRTSNPLYQGADPVHENPIFAAAGGPADLDGDGVLDVVMMAGGSTGTPKGGAHPDFFWMTSNLTLQRSSCNGQDDDCNGIEDGAAVLGMVPPDPGEDGGAFRSTGIKWFKPTKLSAIQTTAIVWGAFRGEPIEVERLAGGRADIRHIYTSRGLRNGMILGQIAEEDGKTKGALYIPDTTFVPDRRSTLVGRQMPDEGLGVLAASGDGLLMKVRPLNDRVLVNRAVVEVSMSTTHFKAKEKANKTKCRSNLRVWSPTGQAEEVTIEIYLFDNRTKRWKKKRVDKATPLLSVVIAEGSSEEGDFISRTGEVKLRVVASAPARVGTWQLEVDAIETEMVALS